MKTPSDTLVRMFIDPTGSHLLAVYVAAAGPGVVLCLFPRVYVCMCVYVRVRPALCVCLWLHSVLCVLVGPWCVYMVLCSFLFLSFSQLRSLNVPPRALTFFPTAGLSLVASPRRCTHTRTRARSSSSAPSRCDTVPRPSPVGRSSPLLPLSQPQRVHFRFPPFFFFSLSLSLS